MLQNPFKQKFFFKYGAKFCVNIMSLLIVKDNSVKVYNRFQKNKDRFLKVKNM